MISRLLGIPSKVDVIDAKRTLDNLRWCAQSGIIFRNLFTTNDVSMREPIAFMKLKFEVKLCNSVVPHRRGIDSTNRVSNDLLLR